MKKITYVVQDRRTKNAVIRQICKENNIDKDSIYCNDYWDYMEYNNDINITLLSTIYKGIRYNFEYFSGCFKAYMVATVLDYQYNINEYNHYILYNNEGVKLHVEAGWQIHNSEKRLFNEYKKQCTN